MEVVIYYDPDTEEKDSQELLDLIEGRATVECIAKRRTMFSI